MKTHNYVGMELRSLFNMIRRNRAEMSAKCATDPSTILHYQTIAFLHLNQGKDIFQRDIEQQFEVRRPTATKFLQLMEQNGLITRENVENDARLKKILLTEKGKKLSGTAMKKLVQFENQLTKGLTDEETEAFLLTIHKIKKNLSD